MIWEMNPPRGQRIAAVIIFGFSLFAGGVQLIWKFASGVYEVQAQNQNPVATKVTPVQATLERFKTECTTWSARCFATHNEVDYLSRYQDPDIVHLRRVVKDKSTEEMMFPFFMVESGHTKIKFRFPDS